MIGSPRLRSAREVAAVPCEEDDRTDRAVIVIAVDRDLGILLAKVCGCRRRREATSGRRVPELVGKSPVDGSHGHLARFWAPRVAG
jgi:hypothetical protein